MSSSIVTRRATASAAAGVVALGGLAIGFVSPADATTTPPTRYTCTSSNPQAPLSVPVAVRGTIKLPASVKAGKSLAGIPATMKVTLPDVLIHNIANTLGFTKLGGTVRKAALQVGKSDTLPLGKLTIPSTKVPKPGKNMNLVASGKTAKTAHAPKTAGKYNVKMPKSFVFNPVSDAKLQTGPLACALTGKAGSFGVMKVHR